ncbi:MAG: response regulator [Thauera sp.]|nr:response regulator [Thauera sp.]
MSERQTRVLVAGDIASDVAMVAELMQDEFDNVFTSVEEGRIAADFEAHRPDVLVLAFNGLERAERYYLGLFRHSRLIHEHPHRTLILCNKEDVRRAFELCRKEYFDDYILFWPMVHDAHRLVMSVLLASRALVASAAAAPLAEIAAHARKVGELEERLDRSLADGAARIGDARASLQRAEEGVAAAMGGLSEKLLETGLDGAVEVRDAGRAGAELARVHREQIAPPVHEAAQAMIPLQDWVGSVKHEVAPQMESVRSLASAVQHLRPLVLAVDDDEFQCKLLGRLLASDKYELVFAHSAAEALGAIRRRRPDLILMDVNLPDVDGVQVTRRIKAVPQYAAIPVVMITGQSERNVVAASLQAGAIDFVVKPFEADMLRAKVAKYISL